MWLFAASCQQLPTLLDPCVCVRALRPVLHVPTLAGCCRCDHACCWESAGCPSSCPKTSESAPEAATATAAAAGVNARQQVQFWWQRQHVQPGGHSMLLWCQLACRQCCPTQREPVAWSACDEGMPAICACVVTCWYTRCVLLPLQLKRPLEPRGCLRQASTAATGSERSGSFGAAEAL